MHCTKNVHDLPHDTIMLATGLFTFSSVPIHYRFHDMSS